MNWQLFSLVIAGSVATATHASASGGSFCPDGSKVLYEAHTPDDAQRIAICAASQAEGDPGAVTVIRGKKSGDAFEHREVAKASGNKRKKVFVLRRYTRPQTTYLKLEFSAADGKPYVVHEGFEHGEVTTSVVWDGGKDQPMVALSEPLSMMALEPVVNVQPYDE